MTSIKNKVSGFLASALTTVSLFVPVIVSGQKSLDETEYALWTKDLPDRQSVPVAMQRCAVPTCSSGSVAAPLSLNGNWRLKGCDKANSHVDIEAHVPGSIHSALARHGVIPQPVLGLADTIAEQCSYQSWRMERTFSYDGNMSEPYLCFKGVANKCSIWLNGRLVACHEGMTGGPEIRVTPFLRKGENNLVVELHGIPQTYHGGWPACANEAWKHTVVANCVYGWHYAKIPSVGIWSDVDIKDRPRVRIDNPFIMTKDLNGNMRLVVDMPKAASDAVVALRARCLADSAVHDTARQCFVANVSGRKGEVSLDFKLDNPQLWWPNDMGDQPVYEAVVELIVKGRTVSSHTVRFGIRTIEMLPLPEGKREDQYCWTFCINGKKTFVKGTGWCTMDVMLDFSHSRYARFLSLAHQQHVQLLRAWGGGIPETDSFYDLCDSLGIMVIQEWPTAWNSHLTQPYEMLEETVRLNMLRLRNHPSLVMWGGGNESDNPFGTAIDMMGRYSVMFDGTRPFHRAEPWGGSLHNYNCWWDGLHLNHNLKMTAPFWGEFGIPSLPCRESVDRYLDGEDFNSLSDPSPAFVHHTPIFGTNGEISRLSQYSGYFMPVTSLDNIILGSQMAQAEGVRHTLERARCMWPNTTGALYYKLNDNYPGLSWSTVDYYGCTKMAHWFVRRAFAPVTTAVLFDQTNLAAQDVVLPYYLLSDNGILKGRSFSARFTAWNHNKALVADTVFCGVADDAVTKLGEIRLGHDASDTEMLYFKTSLYDGDGNEIARNWYFSNYETRKGVVMESKRADIAVVLDGKEVKITNLSPYPAVGVTVSAPGKEDVVTFSDNCLWLDPFETVTILMNIETAVDVMWWN